MLPGTCKYFNMYLMYPLSLSLSLSRSDKKKVGEKKIYLFTDASSGCSDDQIKEIIEGLKAQNIDLVIM